jgi:CheY-like chemotaxis protein
MSNHKVLVVDDEPHLIRSLSFILAKEGFEVAMAVDGEEALQKVGENKPDLMFLDIMMPKKNGYEVCEIIRKIPELNDLYIIVLSAKGGEVDREKAFQVGANEFMTKPFSPLEVASHARKIMETLSAPKSSETVS